jgi:exodeoxyribonuclease V alpha subunit
MNALSVQLRVTSVRSRGKFGGAIFAGKTNAGEQYVAICNHKLLPDASLVGKGQLWTIQGSQSTRATLVDGYRQNETQIEATLAELIRPSGRNIIAWIAECPDCSGIGQVKATKLYDRFGPGLVPLIENRKIAALAEIVGDDAAALLCDAFGKHRVADTLLWLDRLGIPHRIGQKVAKHYKDEARARIEANPYVLIPFEADWSRVDALASGRFGIDPDDPRRLESAVEETLYLGYRHGHTCMPHEAVRAGLIRLLGTSRLAGQALSIDAGITQYRCVDGYLQATGAFVIEQYLARRLSNMCAGLDEDGQPNLFAPLMADQAAVKPALDAYEQTHSLTLAPEQRAAVLTCLKAHLSLIVGGAGTGKTSVLKALYATLEQIQPGVQIHQLALAGRAAQRMAEVTGRDAMTIAGFLVRMDSGLIAPASLVVVDETSMVDVILMYRLLRHLPPDIRLIFVGDPAQLPPIGPGLVLHALAGIANIPKVELSVVHRQSAASGIPRIAAVIRSHRAPEWTAYQGRGTGVSFVPCAPTAIDDTVHRVYAELGGEGSDFTVQVLCVTKSGFGGARGLNGALHDRYRDGAEQVLCYDEEFGTVGAVTLDRVAIKVGDLVLYTVNDYGLGLRNGSLGRIVAALPVDSANDPCCVCDFDGIQLRLTRLQMEALSHAYAITVHKSQGSQFERVVVPIRRTRLLDHALIYTAVTRAVEQVVLVGDQEAVLAAIMAQASAVERHVTLPTLLALEFRK